ncbi:MAG: SurA N-terminal domain-containing protein [Pseudomonadota bacterium]
MLDYFRQGAQTKFAKVILALITVPFALWGVDSYVRDGDAADNVATVNGQKITAREFNQAVKENLDQLRARYNGNVDASLVNNPEFRQSVLDGLINQRVLLSDAVRVGAAISDKQLAERIAAIPAFQEDGKFSKTRYQGLLGQQGMTPTGFETRLRQDLILQAYQQGVTNTTIISHTSVDALIRASEQTREVSAVSYSPEQFVSRVKISEAAIKSYYDSHKQEFTTPDQVKLEYVVLSVDELASQVTVSEEEIKKYYDEHTAQYMQAEERQASHVLIKAASDATEADKKTALVKAEDVLRQAKADPSKFPALAEKYSEDAGSAAKGGDLGFFSKGMMVKPFEDAAFQMSKGEIRGPVQSEFGYHIIKLVDLKPGKGKSLDEVRTEITTELKKQKALKKFAEIAEPFSNMVYEQSSSLKPAADAYKLSINQSQWMTRKGGPTPALNNEKFLQSAFGEEVLKNKRNTEAVEIAPNTLVSARLLEFKASALRPLAEVSSEITAKLTAEEANKLAMKQGKEQLEQIIKGTVPASIAWQGPQQVSRQQPGAMVPAALEAAFKAPVKTLPAYVGVENPQGGYSIVRISKVTDGTPTDEAKKRLYTDRLKMLKAQSEFGALVASLREGAKVKVRKDVLEKKEQ